MAQEMGIGNLGFKNTVFKRKFRFTFEITEVCDNPGRFVPASFVKVAARPSLTIEETEINYLNAKTWIPGKASWETINITYIDVAAIDNRVLYDWLASTYGFHKPIELPMGASRKDYAAVGILKMFDGCGTLLETWELNDLWPTSVNFGDLDYSSSDEATIELTLRYSGVKYTPNCPGFEIASCCTPCS